MNESGLNYPWLADIQSKLGVYIEQNRIPQTLIISGHAGLGQESLINDFIASLLCQQRDVDHRYCGHCQSCLLIQSQTHPDLVNICPEPGKQIGIDSIRQLIQQLMLKPQFESWRVVNIQRADALNQAAANAFLKYLEEPTERTLIIMSCEIASRLPATIRSRCQIISLPQAEQQQVLDWLGGQNISQAEQLLKMSQGLPLLAMENHQQGMLEVYQNYYQTWLKTGLGESNIVTLAETWEKNNSPEFAVLVVWMMQWLIELVKYYFHYQTPAEDDRYLQQRLKKLDLRKVFQLYEELLWVKKHEATQLNKQMIIEKLLILWTQC